MNNQLVGFDIDSSALKLAALNLYLTALELDPHPRPFKDLKFDVLFDRVLIDKKSTAEFEKELGSLQYIKEDEYYKKFDIVIGNPPWGGRGKISSFQNQKFTEETIRIIKNRKSIDSINNYKNPQNVPDLPFVWKATEWCKDDGYIAFALHARLLFSNSAEYAKLALFNSLKVTGILNGSDLRHTELWPEVSAPFCLLFAKNTIPKENSIFQFVSPYIEKHLNDNGILRIDSLAAEPIELKVLNEKPSILKQLFRGSSLDVGVIDKIGHNAISVQKFWNTNNLNNGIGYQVANRKNDAQELIGKGLKNFNKNISKKFSYSIDSNKLPLFNEKGLHRLRNENIYKGPVILINQSPAIDRNIGRGFFCDNSIYYDRSFFGYSANGYTKNARLLVRYLFILIHSQLMIYFSLLFSSQFGVERDAYLKEDIDNFPIIPFENLTQEQIKEIERISEQFIQTPDTVDWKGLDSFVYKLYGLNKWDVQVIEDTLEMNLPFKDNQKKAQEKPDKKIIKEFIDSLQTGLKPFFAILKNDLEIDVIADLNSDFSPWVFLSVSTGSVQPIANKTIQEICSIADKNASSQIILQQKNSLVIGILKQRRYWTKTRARILSQKILFEYEKAFIRDKK